MKKILIALLALISATHADTFRTGANQFSIDFVNIGNTGNDLDITGYGSAGQDHRFEGIIRRIQFDLEEARVRGHILEGYLLAMDNMDEVVRIIRDSKNRDEAQDRLMAKFGFSEIQAKAILEMRLYQLTGLERDKVEAEYAGLIKLYEYLEDLLAYPDKILEYLRQLRVQYGEIGHAGLRTGRGYELA